MTEYIKFSDTVYATGWIPVSDTWTYASVYTLNVPAGALTKYSAYGKVKFTQHGVVKFGYIYPTSDTLLTLYAGSDFVVENTATYPITNINYSNAETPIGFPAVFNYLPVGISASNVTLAGRFFVNNRICFYDFSCIFHGAITFTSMPTLPIPVSALYNSGYYVWSAHGNASYYHSALFPNGLLIGLSNSQTIMHIMDSSGSPMSATVPVTWANNDVVDGHIYYEV